MHAPFFKENCNTKKLVVFIHGFMGSPNQFNDLTQAVHDCGCSYMSVLLPGHGVRTKDFRKFGMIHWEAHLQSELDRVKNIYDEIYLVGHSMGGSLALNASLIKENKIEGVFMIATPLKVNMLNLRSLSQRMQYLVYPKKHYIKAIYLKSCSLTDFSVFSLFFFIKPIINFYKLTAKTKKCLKDVRVPVNMVHSKSDETAAFISSKMLYDGLYTTKREAFVLNKSWHVFFPEDEQKFITEKLISFINSKSG